MIFYLKCSSISCCFLWVQISLGGRRWRVAMGFWSRAHRPVGTGTRTGTGLAPRSTRLMHQPGSGLGSVCHWHVGGRREPGCAWWPECGGWDSRASPGAWWQPSWGHSTRPEDTAGCKVPWGTLVGPVPAALVDKQPVDALSRIPVPSGSLGLQLTISPCAASRQPRVREWGCGWQGRAAALPALPLAPAQQST